MIKSEFNTFIDSYKRAPVDVQRVIDGPAIPDLVQALRRKYPDLENWKRDLIDAIADVLLNITSLRVLLENLRSSEETKEIFTQEILNDISNFVAKERSSGRQLYAEAQLMTTQTNPEPKTTIDTPVPTPPATPPETQPDPTPLTTVKPMRTYSDDVNMSRAHSYGAFRPQEADDEDEQTHSSSQNDLLDRR